MGAGFWIMLSASVLLTLITVYYSGLATTLHGLGNGGRLLLYTFPRMIFAFLVAGLIQVLIPNELISQWLGAESGFKGLIIGSLAGTLTPGGPMMHFPIVASLLHSGVGPGPIIAYLTAWSLLGINRLIIWEIPILGLEISLVRYVASLAIPPFMGLLGGYLFRLLPLKPGL